MNAYRTNAYGYLDRIRIYEGAEKCRAALREACENDRRWAANLLSDSRLSFPCLFLLREQAEAFRLCLGVRCQTALGIIRRILEPSNAGGGAPDLLTNDRMTHSVLKWIVETGNSESGLGDVHDYEEIVDKAASLLINSYRDNSILPHMVDIIFDRSRDGRHVHTLIWALFRAGDPHALKLIAQRIPTADRRDTDLACRLLNIELPGDSPADKTKLYNDYAHWLEENTPFLLFTGESPQFSSRPTAFIVDLERKYVSAGAGFGRRHFIKEEDQKRYREAFAGLSEEDKYLLSDYSYKRYRENIAEWNRWIGSPVEKQLKEAKAEVS